MNDNIENTYTRSYAVSVAGSVVDEVGNITYATRNNRDVSHILGNVIDAITVVTRDNTNVRADNGDVNDDKGNVRIDTGIVNGNILFVHSDNGNVGNETGNTRMDRVVVLA